MNQTIENIKELIKYEKEQDYWGAELTDWQHSDIEMLAGFLNETCEDLVEHYGGLDQSSDHIFKIKGVCGFLSDLIHRSESAKLSSKKVKNLESKLNERIYSKVSR